MDFNYSAYKSLTLLDIPINLCKYVLIVDRQLAPFGGNLVNVFLQVLQKHIIDLKDEASVIIGKVENSIEFSNVPLFEKNIYLTPLEKKQLREINSKLKELRSRFMDIKEEIYKL